MAISSNSNLVIAAAAVGTIAALAGFFAFTGDDASTAAELAISETTIATETTILAATATTLPSTATATADTTVLETTTTSATLSDDYCTVAFEFRDGLTQGPASAETVDVEFYFTRNQSYYERLSVLSPADVESDWATFTQAHGELVEHMEANAWAMSAAASYPSSTVLDTTSDIVQTHLQVYCGVPGF